MTSYKCDPAQIRLGLKILHGGSGPGFVEIRAIYQHEDHPPSRKFYLNTPNVADIIAKDVDALVNRAKVNIYVGRSIRDRQAGDASGIDWVSCLTMDFDSSLRPKDMPASESELDGVYASVRRITLFDVEPYLVNSGNGFQLWWPLLTQVDVRGRRRWWERACKEAESRISIPPNLMSLHTKQDPQFDLPRIVKLPGTWSFKGAACDARPWRIAKIVSHGGFLDPELLFGLATEEAPPVPTDLSVVGIPKRFWEEMQGDELLHDAYLGKRFDLKDPSPSGQDWALVVRLKRKGFSPSEALAILKTSQNTKARTRVDYCEMTVRKAYEKA